MAPTPTKNAMPVPKKWTTYSMPDSEGSGSSEDLAHHAGRLDAGEAQLQPLLPNAEPLVIEPEQMQHSRPAKSRTWTGS